MDQTGAFLGPLLVALVVAETQHYNRAYALLGIPAGLAILALLRAIKLYPDPSRFDEQATPEIRSTGLPRPFWIYMIAGGLIAAGFVDLPLIAFHFQKTKLVSPALIPVLYAVAMGVEGLSALAAGKLFDRMGTPVLIAGVLLAAASNPLVFFGSFWAAVTGMALWGAGMGALQSTMRARMEMASPFATSRSWSWPRFSGRVASDLKSALNHFSTKSRPGSSCFQSAVERARAH